MEIYLIRHTTPQIKKGICYGQSDVPLASTFADEAKLLLKILPEKIAIVYSSPSTRCYQLAKLIPADQVIIDNRLLEFNFGAWEMKRWDTIDPVLLDTWMKDFVATRVPEGENFIDLNKRVKDFITELVEQKYKKIAIVTHGGVIRCFIAYILKTPLKDAFSVSVNYASVTKIVLDENSANNKVEYLGK